MPDTKNSKKDKKTDEKKPKQIKNITNDLVGRIAKPVPNNQSPNIDTDLSKLFPDTIILAGQENKLDTSELEKFTNISNNRSLQYGQIDNMFLDASVSAISKTMVENVCQVSTNGHIMWAESDDINISKFINYILGRMNVDKFLPKWSTCLVKYGDIYLKMLRESDFEDKLFNRDKFRSHSQLNESINTKESLDESINLVLHNDSDSYNFHLEMVADPSTMFELTKHDTTMGFIEVPNDKQTLSTNDMLSTAAGYSTSTLNQGGAYNYRLKTGEINLYQADDYVHASLDDGDNRFPETVDILMDEDDNNSSSTSTYGVKRGKSMFYDVYKIWREKSLLEASLLLARLTKSSVFRLVKLETGNTDKTKSSQLLHQVKDMFEQKRAYQTGQSMENYNNPGPMENWIYFNVRNSVGSISVETVGGDYDPKSMVDLDWWNNKFYGAFGIPKQYFGWTDDATGFNGGTALTVTSSVFQKKIVYIQNALIQMIQTACELYCWQKGLKGYIGNFTIKMKTPLSQDEISAREAFVNKLNEISSAMSLFTDVETKSRRLRLLNSLIKPLEYGDDAQIIIAEEIADAEENERKAKEQAEQEELEGIEGGDDLADLDLGSTEEEGGLEMSGGDDLNLDLGDIPAAPDTPAQEAFNSPTGSVDLYEDLDFLDESTDLPSMDEIEDGEIDFTENN